MISTGFVLFMLFKVIVAFVFIYIILPSLFIRFQPEANHFLDKVFISITHMTFLIILLTYLLAFLKIYETISLFAILIILGISIIKFRGVSYKGVNDGLELKPMYWVLELSDNNKHYFKKLQNRIIKSFIETKSNLLPGLKKAFSNPISFLMPIGVLLLGAYIRFNHSILHSYFGASDAYVHLAWTKYLGSNNPFKDGVYPNGFHAVISSFNKLFLIDSYFVTRFIGALSGVMIILSIYYFVKRIFLNEHAAFLSILFYVFGLGLPVSQWRQISALPEEFGTIFFLPGIYFFNLYIKSKKLSFLILAGESLALAFLIHPYVAVFTSISYLIIFLLNIKSFLSIRSLIRLSAVILSSVFIGLLPLFIGYLKGIRIHSIGYVSKSIEAPGVPFSIWNFINYRENVLILQAFILCALFSVLLLLLIFFIQKTKKQDFRLQGYLSIIVISIVIFILYRSKSFGIIRLMDPSRIGAFMSLTAVVTLVLPINALYLLGKNYKIQSVLKTIITLGLAILIIFSNPITVPKGDMLEYDEAVNNYINISRTYVKQTWTIVSTVEQYQQCLETGWHYNIWEFASILSSDTKKSFSIPTDSVFFFVEKIPLKSKTPITFEDSIKSFPKVTGSDLTKYYTIPENRRVIEAMVYYWAEEYIKKNENMKVYFENDIMKVYILEQDPKKFNNLLSKK